MKIIPLGVNSAFATGIYKDTISIEKLEYLLNNKESLEAIRNKDTTAFVDYSDYDTYEKKAIQNFLNAVKANSEKAYIPKWQSNFLIEFDKPGKVKDNVFRFVVDFGGDIRHSLAGVGLKVGDIDAWYCSHMHSDHSSGLEGIGLCTFFNPFWNKDKVDWHTIDGKIQRIDTVMDKKGIESLLSSAKPDLHAHNAVINDLWQMGEPGLMTLQGIRKVSLETYFNVNRMLDNKSELLFKDGSRTWIIYTVTSTHVFSGAGVMPSYGLFFECSDGKKIYMPTDQQLMAPPQIRTFYNKADVIYQDCETGPKSDVHPHIDDLRKLDSDVKKKLYLYHFTEIPEVDEGEFKGILKAGDVHEY